MTNRMGGADIGVGTRALCVASWRAAQRSARPDAVVLTAASAVGLLLDVVSDPHVASSHVEDTGGAWSLRVREILRQIATEEAVELGAAQRSAS